MKVVKVGVVGVGRQGCQHIGVLSAFEDVEIVAVCDPSSILDSVANDYKILGRHTNINEMLDSEKLDAVLLAPPAHLNGELAFQCLERGIHTFLEKPPGLSLAETTKLRDLATQKGSISMVGWNRRFDSLITQAKNMVEKRGPIVQLVGEFHKNMTALEGSGNFHDDLLDKMLLETPIHSIDLVRVLADSEVVEVHAIARRVLHIHRDVHAALIEFENGCVAQITANYTTDARLERYEIHGDGISAYLEGVKDGYIMSDGERIELDSASDSGEVAEVRFFIDCVKKDIEVPLPGANLEEAMKTMELCEAILSKTK